MTKHAILIHFRPLSSGTNKTSRPNRRHGVPRDTNLNAIYTLNGKRCHLCTTWLGPRLPPNIGNGNNNLRGLTTNRNDPRLNEKRTNNEAMAIFNAVDLRRISFLFLCDFQISIQYCGSVRRYTRVFTFYTTLRCAVSMYTTPTVQTTTRANSTKHLHNEGRKENQVGVSVTIKSAVLAHGGRPYKTSDFRILQINVSFGVHYANYKHRIVLPHTGVRGGVGGIMGPNDTR